MDILKLSDLPIAAQSDDLADLMVRAANARARRVAPCLGETASADQIAEAQLVLIGAVKRWTESGAGSFQQQTAGPFSVATDTRQRGGFNLWPSEITQLQDICSTGTVGRQSFSIDTAPTGCGVHSPICSLVFGATYCSCGADIAGVAIYEIVD